MYNIFSDLRQKRNSLTYYGIRMNFEIALKTIEKCKQIYQELLKILNNNDSNQ